MNDTELDSLLDVLRPPEPPPSLREGLLARYPRAEGRQFASALRWVLAIAVTSIALALAMAQTGAGSSDSPLRYRLTRLYDALLFNLEKWEAPRIVARIRHANPKVYVDGQPAPPLQYAQAGAIMVQVPGDGAYSIVILNLHLMNPDSWPGWVEGRAHGSVVEFQAGGHQVRVECNQPIFDTDRSVFVRRRR